VFPASFFTLGSPPPLSRALDLAKIARDTRHVKRMIVKATPRDVRLRTSEQRDHFEFLCVRAKGKAMRVDGDI
jgi:hypothetical protein